LLASGWPARKILYLDVELAGLEKARDLVAALRSYLDVERSPIAQPHRRLAVLLDEVTRVENWAGALRGLVDNDELRDIVLIATGSHTRDLREGGERLPGRRGGGTELDLELLPLSFREYVALTDPTLSLPPPIGSIDVPGVAAGARERDTIRVRLVALFRHYLATGGFLTALNDEAEGGGVRAETFQIYREAIIGEFTRAGLRESYLREVVNWLAGHLGQEFDYRGIAADTDIGSKDTGRNYIDHLVSTYVATVFYRAPDLRRPSPAFRAPKKVHALDPLFWHLIRAWAAGDADPWAASLASLEQPTEVGHLVESILAVHLRRAFGERVFYWRPDQRREIDFVIAPQNAGIALMEVKYQSRIDEGDVRQMVRAGGGIVATRDWQGGIGGGAVHALPTAEILVLLDAPSLASAEP
jgi:predicted AAA+ superfamily ATPase